MEKLIEIFQKLVADHRRAAVWADEAVDIITNRNHPSPAATTEIKTGKDQIR